MRALQLQSFDGPQALELVELADPEQDHPVFADPGVLIDVHTAGVSFADVLVTKGRYQLRPEPPFVPGYEVAGTVRAAPPDGELREGDRVAACTVVGGFAEVAVAPAWATFRLPDRLDYAEGAGLVLNYHTACFALRRRGRLREDETVLVHGA